MATRRTPAAWSPPRNLSEEGKRFTASYPALYLHVWCNFSGVNVDAVVDRLDSEGRLQRVTIAKATFRTSPPTEEDVALWGARALSAWLEDRIMAMGEAELNGA